MRKVILSLAALAAIAFVNAYVQPAFALAARTFVSGVGDDTNPCSRTAPCRTFAGALAKTAPAGEINCLDPAGYGSVTITQAISIICDNTQAGVIVSGTDGIVVNAGPTDAVYLSGLDIEGLGTGVNGINFIGGGSLHVSTSTIRTFTNAGINFAPGNANASLVINDTIVADNPLAGVLMAPTGGHTASALITNTRMVRNKFGLRMQDGSKASVIDSVASHNVANGFLAVATSAPVELNLTHCISASNGTNGIQSNGQQSLVRMFDTALFDNVNAGISLVAGGIVVSSSPPTNANAGNGTNGAPNGTAVTLQ